ncbi:MAG: HEAT repeat domain-containing protein [Deltaproteobacteria bacterium]|nr:HEAT repeat domain-containing protein [Deltaproteobacteria bacterium]
MPHPGHRKAAAVVCAAFLGGLVAAVAMQPPWLERVRGELVDTPMPEPGRVEAALRARRPVERFYGARAAGRLGQGWEPVLEAALADPVINVRYAAAQALGRIASPRAREVLRGLLEGPADWYVKERAWAGLRRSGWRPGR